MSIFQAKDIEKEFHKNVKLSFLSLLSELKGA